MLEDRTHDEAENASKDEQPSTEQGVAQLPCDEAYTLFETWTETYLAVIQVLSCTECMTHAH